MCTSCSRVSSVYIRALAFFAVVFSGWPDRSLPRIKEGNSNNYVSVQTITFGSTGTCTTCTAAVHVLCIPKLVSTRES